MASLDWQVVADVATTVSAVAIGASAVVVVLQLRRAARERYFSVTAHLFEIWQSTEFQHDQLFLLHKLPSATWEEFCAQGRGETADRAIHRVGGYYDRVGNLVRHRLIEKKDILPTIGGYAVAVWHRIEPLVKELRLRENAVLFENYEWLLPECRECYVPGLERLFASIPVAATTAANGESARERLPSSANVAQVKQSTPLADQITWSTTGTTTGTATGDAHAPVALEFSLPDTDGIAHSLSEFTASGAAVMVYIRGAWCPHCLRQLADYAERYRDFKRWGIEVVAVSPESQRRSRRMRAGLRLPFTVLSDSNLEVAKTLGLIGHERPGKPTAATFVLDSQQRMRLSTLNQREKCLFARDVLEYARGLKEPQRSIPVPKLEPTKPGFLFVRALMYMATGLVNR